MQSEKPQEAKKAQENKLFAKPTPDPGLFMATKKREDQSVAAKLSDEVRDGMDSGVYSQFLHDWVEGVEAIYNPPDDRCTPILTFNFTSGHVEDIDVRRSCGEAIDQMFISAVRNARRDPTPTSWQDIPIPLIFYAGIKH